MADGVSRFQHRPDGLAWDLDLDGKLVHRLIVDYAVSLTFSNDVEVRISCPFTSVAADGSMTAHDPEGDPVLLAPVLRLARMGTRFGHALLDGGLELGFTDGSSLRVDPDEDYEAWTLGGPRGFKLVCLPGGGLAEWTDSEA